MERKNALAHQQGRNPLAGANKTEKREKMEKRVRELHELRERKRRLQLEISN
jgi:hypothetical protein